MIDKQKKQNRIDHINYPYTSLCFCTILSCCSIPYITQFSKSINGGMVDMHMLYIKDGFNTLIDARLALWIVAKNIFIKNHILGVGMVEHISKKNEFTRISHFRNIFSDILTQFEIIGLSIFLYILHLIVKILIQNTKLKILKISLFTIFILGSFTNKLFHPNSTISLFLLIVGIIFTQYQFKNIKAGFRDAI